MRRRAAVTMVVGLLVALVLGACQPAPTSITAAFDSNSIDLGSRATLRIGTTPAKKGWDVALERRSGSRWVKERSGPTRADGTVNWSLLPATAGTYAYRVTSGGTATPTIYLKVTDRVHLGLRYGPYGAEPLNPGRHTLGTTTYARSLASSACRIQQMISYYQPGKAFSRLETVVGMAMSSPQGSYRNWSIKGDGRVLRSGQVVVGSADKVSMDIRGVDVLEVHWGAGWCDQPGTGGTFVLGDPFLYR